MKFGGRISGVDVTGCDGLESWMLAIEEATSLRPVCSSGTSGKISILPHGELEDLHRAVPAGYQFVDGIMDDVSHGVLRDRRNLAEEGVVVVFVTVTRS